MKPVLAFLMFFGLTMYSCQSQPAGGLLDAKTFNEKLKVTKDAFVLDVRTPEEFANGYIDKAVNIDFYGTSFESEVKKLDKGKTYFVYCHVGGRSESAADLMRKAGFTSVFDLDGGIISWQENNLPLVHRPK